MEKTIASLQAFLSFFPRVPHMLSCAQIPPSPSPFNAGHTGRKYQTGLPNTSPPGSPIIPFQSSQWIFLLYKINPIPVVSMDKMNIAKMREWVSEHGQCVRQLCVRQQTTKFSAGTLPMSARVGYKPTNVGRNH